MEVRMAACPACGSQVEDWMAFCPTCGHKLEPTTVGPGPSQSNPAQQANAPATYAQGTNDAELRALAKTRILAIAQIVAFVAAFALDFLLFATLIASFSTGNSSVSLGTFTDFIITILAVSGAIYWFGLYEFRGALVALASVERSRFGLPSSMTLVLLIVQPLALLGVTLTASGMEAFFLIGLLILAISAIFLVVTFIGGFMLGLWRMGGRYEQWTLKAAAILSIIPLFNLMSPILMLLGLQDAKKNYERYPHPSQIPPPEPMSTLKPQRGQVRPLLVIYAVQVVGFALFFATQSAFSVVEVVAEAVLFLAVILSVEFVYKDASMINRERGFKALNATGWSLLTLVLGLITIPWYLLVRRKEAMTAEPGSSSRYQRVFILGLVGAYLLIFGIVRLEPNSLFLTVQENLAIGIIATGAGLILVGAAVTTYLRKRRE